jgi:transcription-repair coupling factor (superfamily II helicase)
MSFDQLLTVKQKMIDIYGKPPKEVELLFKKRKIDILVKEAFIKSLIEQNDKIIITLKNNLSTIRGVGNMIFQTLTPYIGYTKIVYTNHEFVITMAKRKTWIENVESLLESLLNICKENNLKE